MKAEIVGLRVIEFDSIKLDGIESAEHFREIFREMLSSSSTRSHTVEKKEPEAAAVRARVEASAVRAAAKREEAEPKAVTQARVEAAEALEASKKPEAPAAPEAPEASELEEDAPPPRRGPGRPRKEPEADAPPQRRGPGRPRKEPEDDAPPPRARREVEASELEEDAPPPRRGPGRPRKEPEPEAPPARRGPGRPKKEAEPEAEAQADLPEVSEEEDGDLLDRVLRASGFAGIVGVLDGAGMTTSEDQLAWLHARQAEIPRLRRHPDWAGRYLKIYESVTVENEG